MMSDDLAALMSFKGIARLFPLPNVVLFPYAVQGLHVFEPRYRQMTSDALTDDRLIALVLLRPGWEKEYQASPAVYPVACLGRIVADQKLPDGRYNLQLRGLSRVRIEAEVPNGRPYRSARVTLLAKPPGAVMLAGAGLRRKLLEAVLAFWPPHAATDTARKSARDNMTQLIQGNVPLDVVCDILSFALPLPIGFKQELLETRDVERRLRKLLEYLAAVHSKTHSAPADEPSVEAQRGFPPDFSTN